MKIQDFDTIAPIGKGGYGNVVLVRHKISKNIFAMKKVKKVNLQSRNQFDKVKTERDILTQTHENPWLVQMHYSFQDDDNLYLVMEFYPGGDLRSLISTMGALPESDAKFYIAEMIVAVGCLHELGYIHRDLKPDNFLVGKSGHLTLADFGLSKVGLKEIFTNSIKIQNHLMNLQQERKTTKSYTIYDFRKITSIYRQSRKQKLYSLVGSPDYMAIELLMGQGYDFAVDWWSVGVIAFELVVGVPPFFADTPLEVFKKIQNYKECLKELSQLISMGAIDMSDTCWDFINGLLCEPEKRLGQRGVEDILTHRFFADLNLKNLRSLKPPFIPKLESSTDLKYFEGDRDKGEDSFEDLKKITEETLYVQSYEEEIQKEEETHSFLGESSASRSPSKEKILGFTYKRKDSPFVNRRRGSVVDVNYNPAFLGLEEKK